MTAQVACSRAWLEVEYIRTKSSSLLEKPVRIDILLPVSSTNVIQGLYHINFTSLVYDIPHGFSACFFFPMPEIPFFF